MSKDTLKQAADALFASTAHNLLWANPKGEFFTSENTGNLSLKAGQKLTKFERPEEKPILEVPTVKPVSATDTIVKIEATTSLEDLKAFELDERKTVKAAYDEQHAKLVAAIKVNLDDKGEGTGAGNEDTDTQK